jgi:ketosteroid isomerase-like protein
MKKPLILLFSIILLCIAFGCKKKAEKAAMEMKPIFHVEADKEAIKVLIDHFFKAHETGDLDGLMATFSDGAIFMPDDAATIDKNAARDRFAPMFEYFDMEVSPSVDEIEVSGNLGFARCSYVMNATSKAEGKTTLYDDKFIFILKRQKDHSWRSSHFIWNDNKPPQKKSPGINSAFVSLALFPTEIGY